MFKICFSAVALVFLGSAAQADVGFRTVGIGGEGPRPLNVALWYPAKGGAPGVVVGETPAFVGARVVRDAQPSAGAHPLVVLSHGYGGTWRNLSWLAAALADEGYAVAAPDHPGTTHFNRDRRQASMLWERPRDLSRVIDAVLEGPALAGSIAPERIAAIGHSLGGWTVTALAGGRFDPDLFARDCASGIASRACPTSDLNDMGDLKLDAPGLRQDMHDPRIRAFVSLDPGFARGFDGRTEPGACKIFFALQSAPHQSAAIAKEQESQQGVDRRLKIWPQKGKDEDDRAGQVVRPGGPTRAALKARKAKPRRCRQECGEHGLEEAENRRVEAPAQADDGHQGGADGEKHDDGPEPALSLQGDKAKHKAQQERDDGGQGDQDHALSIWHRARG
ncbi:alpha/beta fold hydrolase [Nitratireductor aquimarinus]|uniref:alpha/beta hydrolase family protein n=1 Tax=Nitratireductor aquimarinus TaxID=889300 RepID=UPI001A8F6FEE|nr:alpha/beta fold hydrolase [Nitratireductor aquimarinus]MBN8245149.1 alpha/beta fold hydrolase [Nitratireductor aquimarinus]MBY6133534.1 alpha/beta fold hydrolase [Nitratireductor aquimarinus]MCA1304815.1 alpha/beta fold hydrolase [Nitratireductor aquimarinus]